jgi:hypothetical protein
VVGTDSDNIHLFYDDGSEALGFPYQTGGNIRSAPSILDVNGQKVIFAGSDDSNLYAINSDGSLRFAVMATNKIYNSPAFLDHNDSFYVFFSDDSGILYAVDTDGNALSGWPVDAGVVISKSVVFSDMDCDGEAEVIAVTEMADVMVYNLDGSYHDGFPMDDEFVFTAAPMVMDMDGDGDLDVLVASFGISHFSEADGDDSKIVWYENNGAANPSFTQTVLVTNNAGAHSAQPIDLDHDGDMDFVVADGDSGATGGNVSWWENNGAADPSWSVRSIDVEALGAAAPLFSHQETFPPVAPESPSATTKSISPS